MVLGTYPVREAVADSFLSGGHQGPREELIGNLRASMGDEGTAKVVATHDDADEAVELANTAAAVMIAHSRNEFRRELEPARERAHQLAERAESELAAARSALLAFVDESGAGNVNDPFGEEQRRLAQSIVSEMVIEEELLESRAMRRYIERVATDSLARGPAVGLDPLRVALEAELLSAERELLLFSATATADHPELQERRVRVERLRTELGQLADQSQGRLQRERDRRALELVGESAGNSTISESMLMERLDALRDRSSSLADALGELPDRQLELEDLRFQLERARSRPAEGRDRLATLDIEIGVSTGSLRLLEAARIATPVDTHWIPILYDTLASFAAALVLMLLAEALDPKLHDLRALVDVTGRPLIGFVPRVGRRGPAEREVAGAHRRIAAVLVARAAETGAKVISITSVSPGEGRTLVARGLLAALVEIGQRVVFVDSASAPVRGEAADEDERGYRQLDV